MALPDVFRLSSVLNYTRRKPFAEFVLLLAPAQIAAQSLGIASLHPAKQTARDFQESK